MDFDVAVSLAHADRKPIGAIVSFRPPAVEDRQVESAIQHDLLAAGPRCLQWTTRVVQPHIHPLHQVPGHIHVVIFHEDQFAREDRIAHHLGNLLQNRLAGDISRMGLAREYELDRPLRIID